MMDNEKMKAVDLKIKEKSKQGRISCKLAQEIGDELALPYSEVGKRCEVLDIKISACQLGCF
ncbi:hypothetical protein JR334_06745 [Clostridia bacterium]|nr:hypothetical protein JR334_06745 [Clostridia bacterium]